MNRDVKVGRRDKLAAIMGNQRERERERERAYDRKRKKERANFRFTCSLRFLPAPIYRYA